MFFARTTLSSVILCFYCAFCIMVVLVWMPELVQVSRRQNDLYVLTRGLTHSLSESNNKLLCCQNASFTMDAFCHRGFAGYLTSIRYISLVINTFTVTHRNLFRKNKTEH